MRQGVISVARKIEGNVCIGLDIDPAKDLYLNDDYASLCIPFVPGERGPFFRIYDKRPRLMEALKKYKSAKNMSVDQFALAGKKIEEKQIIKIKQDTEKELVEAFCAPASVYSDYEKDGRGVNRNVLVFEEPELEESKSLLSAINFSMVSMNGMNSRFWKQDHRDPWTRFLTKVDEIGNDGPVKTRFLVLSLTSASKPFSLFHRACQEDGKVIETIYNMDSSKTVKEEVLVPAISEKKTKSKKK